MPATDETPAVAASTAETRPRDREVLLFPVGSAILGVGASVCGTATVALLLWLLGIPLRFNTAATTISVSGACYIGFALVTGTAWTTWLQRRTAHVLTLDRDPTPAEAKRALRLPVLLALVSAVLWLAGTAILGIIAYLLVPGWDALGLTLAIALGGFETTGITYLLAERAVRPILARALEVVPPSGSAPSTVLFRLILIWALASGLPLVDLVLVLVLPSATLRQRTSSAIVLACVVLVAGAAATYLFARGVAAPLHRLRTALRTLAGGRTDVAVRVDDATEIGALQVSVNQMVRGLRAQRRMRDLFGRHVGTEVASHALRVGASLTGEVCEATALFVDVVDSTVLAHRIPPDEVVRKLNRFFSAVVEAADEHGGLVNKFAGDAALCVFGAPAPLDEPCTAALAAARRIRDEVRAAGELDLGIGIATGEVFAGQLGASTRLEYAVIGDPVNEASRLTEHAKQVPGRILASGAVVTDVPESELCHWQPYAPIALRGFDTTTDTYAAVGK